MHDQRVDEEGAAPAAPAPAPVTKSRRHTLKLAGASSIVGLVIVFGIIVGLYATHREPLSALLPTFGQTRTPHYLFSIYGVERPLGVAADADGNRIYVTQSGGDRTVQVFDRSGHKVGSLTPPASTGELHTPVYLAIDPRNGDVYVSDRMAASIYVYDSSGKYRKTFLPGQKLEVYWSPMGLAFDHAGHLFVTNLGGSPPGGDGPAQRVFEFSTDGTLVRTYGADAKLNFPNGVAVDGSGDVFVSDSDNSRLVVFTAAGGLGGQISGGEGDSNLGLPRGVAVDGNGALYVVDNSAHTVKMYRTAADSLNPAYTGSFGIQGQDDGDFEYPNGIATDAHARVYVADRENNRIQVWTY